MYDKIYKKEYLPPILLVSFDVCVVVGGKGI